MAIEGLSLNATARVKLTKLDDSGNVICAEEHEVVLSGEEAKSLWDLQQQE